MEIHVARDGSALGVYSPDEVRSGLADGRFRASDLAWRAGMATWTPLAEWPEFVSAPSATATAAGSPGGAEWETRPSLGALFRGMVATVLAPSVLADARLGFGRSLGSAYLALLVGIVPFTGLVLLNQQVEPLQMEVLAGVAESFNPAFAAGFRDGFREQQGGEQPGAGIMACVSVCMLSVLPCSSRFSGCSSGASTACSAPRHPSSAWPRAASLSRSGWVSSCSLSPSWSRRSPS